MRMIFTLSLLLALAGCGAGAPGEEAAAREASPVVYNKIIANEVVPACVDINTDLFAPCEGALRTDPLELSVYNTGIYNGGTFKTYDIISLPFKVANGYETWQKACIGLDLNSACPGLVLKGSTSVYDLAPMAVTEIAAVGYGLDLCAVPGPASIKMTLYNAEGRPAGTPCKSDIILFEVTYMWTFEL